MPVDVVEASLADLCAALEAGRTSSVGLVAAYLQRIAAYDHHGIKLNSTPYLSPAAFDEARASDLRRRAGALLSPLDGIPFTAKASYKAAGMPVTAGSPAFRDLIANEDSFAVGRLRAAGAVLLGLTNMPPMANGGMQRGLDGRAESPYNGAYLTSAWWSGSSNGSGTATAASFAAFGLGEETWSSGRAPAGCNALCAYTPSWGVISTRGNWPLVPTMDVVVPHTRSMADMLALLDVVVGDDTTTRGDFWRVQPRVDIPKTSALRPESYVALAGNNKDKPLAGKTIGMPRCFLGTDEHIPTRPSVLAMAHAAANRLRALGADVVACGLPVRDAYECRDRPDAQYWFQGGLEYSGHVPEGYFVTELEDLCAFALDDFLSANGAPGLSSFADVDPELVFPHPVGQCGRGDNGDDNEMGNYVRLVKEGRARAPKDIPLVAEGVAGLNRARMELFDSWMDKEGFYALAWPTLADVAPANADTNPASYATATRDGTWVANGNLFPRHLGIPTVTVPMGLDAEIGMPFGLTFAGRGWDDVRLLELGALFERAGGPRAVPTRTPALPDQVSTTAQASAVSASTPPSPASTPASTPASGDALTLTVEVEYRPDSQIGYTVHGRAASLTSAGVSINGAAAEVEIKDNVFVARGFVRAEEMQALHSHWRRPYGTMIVATARGEGGEVGALAVVGGE